MRSDGNNIMGLCISCAHANDIEWKKSFGIKDRKSILMDRVIFEAECNGTKLFYDPKTDDIVKANGAMDYRPVWDREIHECPNYKRIICKLI